MRPLKSAVPLAKWLLRIALALIAYIGYFDTTLTFSFNSINYFIAAVVVLLAILLLIGGFLAKPSLTVISGLLILIVFVFLMFYNGVSVDSILAYFVPASIGFYFMARGNRG